MARRLSLLLGLLFLFSISASAQGPSIFGGYSYERLGTSPGRNLNGVEIEAQYGFTNWFRVNADLDAHFGLPSHADGRTLHFMAGPEIALPGRWSPFVHAMAGFGHIYDNGFSGTSFAGALGGGVDYRVAPLFSWRVIQADDVVTNFFGGTQHSVRLSTGFVIHF
ncbi:MAG TPA: outer membrane beta-barrel protein [Candidatus Acidoferrales bacterium]